MAAAESAPEPETAAWAPTVGASVKARFHASTQGKFGTSWYTGSVKAVHNDGTVDVGRVRRSEHAIHHGSAQPIV